MNDLNYLDVEVTQEDIRLGCKHSRSSCPIARAISNKFDSNLPDVRVNYDTVELLFSDFSITYCLPVKARHFIPDFDIGRKVKPLKFRITNGQVKNETPA